MNTRALLSCVALAIAGCSVSAEEKVTLPPTAEVQAPKATTTAIATKTAEAPPPTATATSQPSEPAIAGSRARLTGNTAAHRETAVASEGQGILTELLVREGDYVEAGQVIAKLNTQSAQLRVRQARAAVLAAQVQLSGARRERDRLTKLQAKEAIPAAQVDQAITATDGASAGLEANEAALAMARKAVNDGVIKAPYAGVVTRRLKAEGEFVSVMPPSPIVQLAEVTPLDVKVSAPERLLSEVKVGDPVSVLFPAIGRREVGKVARLVPVIDPQTRAFTVIIELANADRSLAPGLFAELDLLPREGATP